MSGGRQQLPQSSAPPQTSDGDDSSEPKLTLVVAALDAIPRYVLIIPRPVYPASPLHLCLEGLPHAGKQPPTDLNTVRLVLLVRSEQPVLDKDPADITAGHEQHYEDIPHRNALQ